MDPIHFWQHPPAEVLKRLHASARGLTSAQAAQRLRARRRKEKDHPAWIRTLRLFVGQFTSPLVLLLVFAALLSAVMGNREDALILVSILFLTGVVSFWQEYRAGQAVQKLRAILHVTCNVVRDGNPRRVGQETVVPGDLVLLAAGDLVPADCLLLAATDLHVNESTLTGESFPVEKEPGRVPAESTLAERRNTLFAGSNVISGTARAVAVRTGADTEFGKIKARMEGLAPETAFRAGIRQFGQLLLRMTLVLSAGILVCNLALGKPVAASALFSIALAIGLAPELLPAIMVTTLATGAQRLAREKVIVKKLEAIQNLGAINILCSDKTGTLTTGEARLAATFDADGRASDRVRLLAYLNASFESGFTNPMDEAIRKTPGVDITGFAKTDEVPYDFERKRLSVAVHDDRQALMITKGALSNVLAICDRVATDAGTVPLAARNDALRAQYETYSAQGFRTIGLAYKEIAAGQIITKADETGMVFQGFLLLEDPAKADIAETVGQLKALGITLKIITGDNRLAAAHLSAQIGLENRGVLTGQEMDVLEDPVLARRALATDLFAEIDPQQKERLIRVLRIGGDIVGYLGDGINDAAALRAADVGISVHTASDVAKEAADIVLLEKDLVVLRKGILDGRKTYLNTLKYIFITTSANFGNMFSLAGISLFLPWLPLLPTQILLLNFLSDIPALTIASDEVDEEQLVRPKRWNTAIIRRFMIVFGIQSSLFDYLTFGLLLYVFKAGEQTFQTGWFVESALTEIVVLLLIRTVRPVFRSRPSPWLLAASAATVVAILLLPYLPIGWKVGLKPLPWPLLGFMTSITLLYGVLVEITKRRFFRKVSL